ncbi:MAG: addiction module toxin RelE [Roseiflexaceae bacterium]
MPELPHRFAIVYASSTKQHLRTIEAKFYSLIRTTIEQQLSFEPSTETRNRKPLKRPVIFMATWEIRFGVQNQFRVYYDVDPDQDTVSVLAIGTKHGNRVRIGAEEIEL